MILLESIKMKEKMSTKETTSKKKNSLLKKLIKYSMNI